MTRSTRWLLFISSIIAFICASYFIVLYALGYKYDDNIQSFIKTGAFQIESNTDGLVYVNNLFAGETSFINSKFTMQRLLPRIYSVRLEREGYHTWIKDIRIEGGHYAEYPRVVLLPNELPIENFASISFTGTTTGLTIKDGQLIVRGQKQALGLNIKTGLASAITLKEADQVIASASVTISPDKQKELIINNNGINIRWLNDANYQPYHTAGDEVTVIRTKQKPLAVAWYRDSNHIIVANDNLLQFIEIDTRGAPNIINIMPLNGPFAYDLEGNNVYIITKKNIQKIRLSI